MQLSDVRIYAILARKTPLGVVFRRGPSKKVLVIAWNTSDDSFQCGQWLTGRIYERRCDLSPNGDLLLYFAANYRKPYQSWSAISRPPFLTALALWPKGDGWGGGGHFPSANQVALNHRPDEMELAHGSLPRWLRVKQFGERAGWGEDDPVWRKRLKRDGWHLVSYPQGTKDDYGAKVWIEFHPPLAWRKPNPLWPKRYSLEMSITGLKERNGPLYLTEHSVIRSDGGADNIGRSDWADWSHSGDLLFAMDGCLFRVPQRRGNLAPLEDAKKLADFSNLRFENHQTPENMRRWPR